MTNTTRREFLALRAGGGDKRLIREHNDGSMPAEPPMRVSQVEIEPVLQRAGSLFKSDYDRRQVLEHVAASVPLDQKGATAYVQAMSTMKSASSNIGSLVSTVSLPSAEGGSSCRRTRRWSGCCGKRTSCASIAR